VGLLRPLLLGLLSVLLLLGLLRMLLRRRLRRALLFLLPGLRCMRLLWLRRLCTLRLLRLGLRLLGLLRPLLRRWLLFPLLGLCSAGLLLRPGLRGPGLLLRLGLRSPWLLLRSWLRSVLLRRWLLRTLRLRRGLPGLRRGGLALLLAFSALGVSRYCRPEKQEDRNCPRYSRKCHSL
jgi:hypothetical protein